MKNFEAIFIRFISQTLNYNYNWNNSNGIKNIIRLSFIITALILFLIGLLPVCVALKHIKHSASDVVKNVAKFSADFFYRLKIHIRFPRALIVLCYLRPFLVAIFCEYYKRACDDAKCLQSGVWGKQTTFSSECPIKVVAPFL